MFAQPILYSAVLVLFAGLASSEQLYNYNNAGLYKQLAQYGPSSAYQQYGANMVRSDYGQSSSKHYNSKGYKENEQLDLLNSNDLTSSNKYSYNAQSQSRRILEFSQETRSELIREILSRYRYENIGYEQLNECYASLENIINNVDVESIVSYDSLVEQRMVSEHIDVESWSRTIYEEYNLREFWSFFERLLVVRGVRDERYISIVHENFVRYLVKLSLSGYSKQQIFGFVNYMRLYLSSLTERLSVQTSSGGRSAYQVGYGSALTQEQDRSTLIYNAIWQEYSWLVNTEHESALREIIDKYVNIEQYSYEECLSRVKQEVSQYVRVRNLQQQHYQKQREYHEDSYDEQSSQYSSNQAVSTSSMSAQVNQEVVETILSESTDIRYEELYSYYSVLENIISNVNVESLLEIDTSLNVDIESVQRTILEEYSLTEFQSYFQSLLSVRGISDQTYISNVYNNFVRYIAKLRVSGYSELRLRKVVSYMKRYLSLSSRQGNNNLLISPSNKYYGRRSNKYYGGSPNKYYGGSPNKYYGGSPNTYYGGSPNTYYGGSPNNKYYGGL